MYRPHELRRLGCSLWREVLYLKIDEVAHLDRVAASFIDVIDGGPLHSQHLAYQRCQLSHRPALLAPEHRRQRLSLLLGSLLIHQHPDPPAAVGHLPRGVTEDAQTETANVHAVDLPRGDVEGHQELA